MVSEVTAWKANDGSIHVNELDALKHDGLIALKALDVFNHASAQAAVNEAGNIVKALAPLVDYLAGKE